MTASTRPNMPMVKTSTNRDRTTRPPLRAFGRTRRSTAARPSPAAIVNPANRTWPSQNATTPTNSTGAATHHQPRRGAVTASGRGRGELPFGGDDDVGEQQGPGHRTHPAGVGADPARDLGDVRGHVAGDLAVDPADAHVEHRGARLDHVP